MPFLIQWVDQCSGSEQVSMVQTPVGNLLVYTRENVICASNWTLNEGRDVMNAQGLCESELARMIGRYCLNPEQVFHIQLLKQGTAYRQRVWHALGEIPFGATASYSGIAKRITSSPRAVGNACRDNPFALLIPCHRVVAVKGAGGYCGQTGGDLMAIKHRLLAFEANYKTLKLL